MGKLKSAEIWTKEDGTYSDGDGLYLRVRREGKTREWIYRGTLNGKAVCRGLGSCKDLTITEARQRAKDYKPRVIPKILFKDLYYEALEALVFKRQWKNPRTKEKYQRLTETVVLPILGSKKIGDISTKDLYEVLKDRYIAQNPSTIKIISHVKDIYEQFEVLGYNVESPTLNLRAYFPKPSKVHTVIHRKALPYQEVPSFIKSLFESKDYFRLPITFLILTCLRRNECFRMKWEWIKGDFIEVPAEILKGHKTEPLKVFLTDEMKKILSLLNPNTEYVFQADTSYVRGGNMLGRLHKINATLHGFRSSFRDWSIENNKNYYASEVILSHTIGNNVVRSYLRSDIYKYRIEIYRDWSKYCFSLMDDTLCQ